MNSSQKQFISIIRNVVCQDGTPIPEGVDWEAVWMLAKRNHLEVVAYSAAPEEYACYKTVYYSMISRSIKQGILLGQIESILTEAGICYAPQKGSILKNDYPKIYMRFMSDIDIYINPDDRESIRTEIGKIQGVLSNVESGDEQFLFTDNLGIEFHGRLLYKLSNNRMVNYPDWSLVNETKNRLTEEGYALNLFGHAVNDLYSSGLGIRYVLDLWVYKNRHQPQPDWNYVWNRLASDGIDIPARKLLELSEYLFGEGEESDCIAELADYILDCGLYGDAVHYSANEIARAGGKMRSMVRQVIRNRQEYENRYSWLRKFPFLLPVAWIIRTSNTLVRNRKHVKKWMKGIKETDATSIKKHSEIMKRFGF